MQHETALPMPAVVTKDLRQIILEISPSELECFAERATALLRQLIPSLPALTSSQLVQLAASVTEIVLFLVDGKKPLATAQASLLLPAGEPTAYISNVVADAALRGHGLGMTIMEELLRLAKDRWGGAVVCCGTRSPQVRLESSNVSTAGSGSA